MERQNWGKLSRDYVFMFQVTKFVDAPQSNYVIVSARHKFTNDEYTEVGDDKKEVILRVLYKIARMRLIKLKLKKPRLSWDGEQVIYHGLNNVRGYGFDMEQAYEHWVANTQMIEELAVSPTYDEVTQPRYPWVRRVLEYILRGLKP